jgi:hypothetical protein
VGGLVTVFHVVPFQCRIRILTTSRLGWVKPTAHAFLADAAATPESGGKLLRTCVHALPFQRRITLPTAQALLAEVAVTPSRESSGPGLGLGTRFHALPFQCKIKVLK